MTDNPGQAAGRNHGTTPRDFTSEMPAERSWSIQDLPEILYQDHPTPNDLDHPQPSLIPSLIFGNRLRDFPGVLPDRITSNVEPWLLEAWFRLNSNIQWSDITDRIHPETRPWFNILQVDRTRFREHFHLRAWGRVRGNRQVARNRVLDMEIQHAGIDVGRNTTRGLTPGLIDPLAGPYSRRLPVPERWLRLRPQRAANLDRVLQNTARMRRAMSKKDTQQRPPSPVLSASGSGRKSNLASPEHSRHPQEADTNETLQSMQHRANDFQQAPASNLAAFHSSYHQGNQNPSGAIYGQSAQRGPVTRSRAAEHRLSEGRLSGAGDIQNNQSPTRETSIERGFNRSDAASAPILGIPCSSPSLYYRRPFPGEIRRDAGEQRVDAGAVQKNRRGRPPLS